MRHAVVVAVVVVAVSQAYRTQLAAFLTEVRSHTQLPLLKQHLVLYSSIDIQVRHGLLQLQSC
jgi:hypothetical protein